MAHGITAKNNITGGAIAHRLRGKGFTGERLDRAIEEVADDMTTRGMNGSDLLSEQWLAEINRLAESDVTHEWQQAQRSWTAIRREAKRIVRAIG